MALETLLRQLNASQHEAVTLPAVHALVLAGAGSGKTRTIVARAAYLIASGTSPDRVQILTFTRRAAAEVVERVRLTLGGQSAGLRASTFHTWCSSLLRRAPQQFGINDFSLLDRDDQLQMLRLIRGRQQVRSFPTAEQILDLYSFARNTRNGLERTLQLKDPAALPHRPQLLTMMREYERRKRLRNYLDYDDMLDIVAQGMAQFPELAGWVAQQYDYLLVDEMQDTNPLQWALLEPLSRSVRLFCVGDDAQSIYGFRGADFQNVHRFAERVPGATVLKLEDNYRSTQPILDLANWLLAQSPLAYERRLRAVRGAGQRPQLRSFATDWEEAGWIAADLTRRRTEGAQWRDHMILVRSAYSARSIEQALMAAEIPYSFIGGTRLLEAAHVRDLLSLLRVVGNPQDEIGWMRYLTLWPGIGDVSAAELVDRLLTQPREAQLAQLADDRRFPPAAAQALAIGNGLERQVAELVRQVSAQLSPLLAERYREDWERRSRDFAFVAQLAEAHHSVLAFIEAYILDPVYTSQVRQSEDSDVVLLITVHSAKGTESDVCYLPDASVGSYPSSRALDTVELVEEERRVLYVALTRARNELILTRRNYVRRAQRQFRAGAGLPAGDSDDRLAETYFLNGLPVGLVDDLAAPPPAPIAPPADDGTGALRRTIRYGIDLE